MEAGVVSAAHGAVGSLIEKLAALLLDKYKLVKGAKGQIELLQNELKAMYSFLETISGEEDPAEIDKCHAKEVRELSYDIEDSIDEFMLRVERKSNSKPSGFKGFVERCVNLLTTMKIRHKIAKEFKDIQSRVKEVSKLYKRYDIKPNNTTISDYRDMARNIKALHGEVMDPVGIDGPRDELLQWMDEEGAPAHQRKVLSIVGFGGLGKTTLANQIYDKLQGQFDCRAKVSVSRKPNIKTILRIILHLVHFEGHNNANIETWEVEVLINELRTFLLHKRYLILIDDIWDDIVWDIIKCALPENRNGSRIITTTRIGSVGKACCTNPTDYVYKMKPLSDPDSKSLFFKRIFDSDACPQNLEEVSAKSATILKKCAGLPLAIITISSLLASEPDKWEYVLKYLNSLGSNWELSPSWDGMRQILNLSYINLPHRLKTCMLYLGIFPEDYTIDKNDLIRQWIAEGFVSKAHVTDPEGVANIHFNELINRSMIQPVEIDYNGKVISCKVHDMMLDLILSKCREQNLEQNFITVIDNTQHVTGQRGKIRRLSLHMDGAIDDEVVRSDQLPQIRTLARFAVTSDSYFEWWHPPSIISEFEIPKGSRSSYLPTLEQFRHLRVLTIEILGGSRTSVLLDFTGIYGLFQLRYLKIIAEIDPVVLPRKIGALQQLETIHLQTKVQDSRGQTFEELPSDIVYMSGLLHLIVPLWRRLPNGIGNMKSLRTLRWFDLCSNTPDNIRGLKELTNLTDLLVGCRSELIVGCLPDRSITTDEVAERGREVLSACLENLCNLKHLEIRTNYYKACLDVLCSVPACFCHLERFHVDDNCWFSRAPAWIGQFHSLYDLRLQVMEVLEEDVGMLAQLQSLIHLHLCIKGTPKDKIIVRGSGFPCLKHLIVACIKISCLTFEVGAMAKLERLELGFDARGWDRYGAAPAGIEHLLGLKEIRVDIGGFAANKSNRRAAKSALRDAVDMHPGRPTANIKCSKDFRFGFDENESEEEDVKEECGEEDRGKEVF